MNRNEIDILVSDDVVRVEASGVRLRVGSVATLFRILAEDGVSVDLISLSAGQKPGTLTFSVSSRDFSKVLRAAAQLKENAALRISVQGGYSKITLRGNHLPYEAGIASACFRALTLAETETVLVSASGTVLSVLVQTDALDRTLACFENIFHTTPQEV